LRRVALVEQHPHHRRRIRSRAASISIRADFAAAVLCDDGQDERRDKSGGGCTASGIGVGSRMQS
jgi:hypothetical protein